jgi:tetratricopeptide (TPR) repeat protein
MEYYKLLGLGMIFVFLFFGCVQPPVSDEQNAIEMAHETAESKLMLQQQEALSKYFQCTPEEYTQSLEGVTDLFANYGILFDTQNSELAYDLTPECEPTIREDVTETPDGYRIGYRYMSTQSCPHDELRDSLNIDTEIEINVRNGDVTVPNEMDVGSVQFFNDLMSSSGNCYSQIFVLSMLQEIESEPSEIMTTSSEAIGVAVQAFQKAEAEGRTSALQEASGLLDFAVSSFEAGNYEEALTIAEEAERLANSSVVPITEPDPEPPIEAQQAFNALTVAYNEVVKAQDEGRTVDWASANTKYEEALTAYNNEEYINAMQLAADAERLAKAATLPAPPPTPVVNIQPC